MYVGGVQPIQQKKIRSVLLALTGAVSIGALVGCSPVPSGPASTSSTTPETSTTAPPTAPWEDSSVPTVLIEFEADGETHTVSGEIPDGLRSCAEDGMIVIAGTSSEATLGVSFEVGEGDSTHAGVWAIQGDYAVQMLTEALVETVPAADGGTNYSTVGATGRVSVLPRDPQKMSIGEYDFQEYEPHDGTASFTVNCP